MSLAETLGRIQQIQSTLSQLAQVQSGTVAVDVSGASGVAPAALSGAADSAGTGSADAFAKALDGTSAGSDIGAGVGANSSANAVGGADKATAVSGVTNKADATGADLVAAAKKYVGVPYVWGGEDKTGMDCSGFVQRAFKDLGIDMPRLARAQMDKGTPVASFADAKPGDLISSFNGDHISIYLGNGKAIDAPVPGKTVQIRDAWEMTQNLEKIVRVLPADASEQLANAVKAAGTGSAPGTAKDLVSAAQSAMISGGML